MPDPALVPARLVRGSRGAVVAPHHLATAAGLAVLGAGGHAVDAAIATNAVLGVAMPNGSMKCTSGRGFSPAIRRSSSSAAR